MTEEKDKGWIKLWRKMQYESSMYRSLNSKQRDVMMQCLMCANHEKNKWEWKGELHICEPGQFKTSLNSLKEKCASDVSIQNIRTALKKLETWEFLTNESTKSGRVITICNWKVYQNKDNEANKDSNKQLTNNQQRANKELTSNKNDKECLKNEKNDKEIPKSQDSKTPDDPKFQKGDRPYEASCYLRKLILENNHRASVPDETPADMESWSIEMDRLNRLGPPGGKSGYSWEEIRKIIDWCQDNSFWKSNILSVPKLREKIVMLENQMNRKKDSEMSEMEMLKELYNEDE